MEERKIDGAELREKLTDVIQVIVEEKVVYVIETLGRPQAIMLNLDEYRRLQDSQFEKIKTRKLAEEAFGMWRDRDDFDDEWLARVRKLLYSDWM